MIPLELWNSEEMKKRRENAVAKALKEKPKVFQIQVAGNATNEGFRMYSKAFEVKDAYTVEVYRDADDQYFVSCSCAAGRPPIDEATGLPSREAQPCYHVAATLIHIAQEEKDSQGETNV